MRSSATAKNVLFVGSGFVTGVMEGTASGTVNGNAISLEVVQLDDPPASKLSVDSPCQSDLMVSLLQKDDSCYYANDNRCNGNLYSLDSADATDCRNPPVRGE